MGDVGGIGNFFHWLTEGPARVCADVNALSDALKIVQKVNDIFKEVVGPIVALLPLRLVAESFSRITEFVSARSIVGRISDLVSGDPRWYARNHVVFPEPLRLASTCAGLIGDVASTAKWLSSIHILGASVKDTMAQLGILVKKSTGNLEIWGGEFNLLKGIGDVSSITSALLNMMETAG